MFRQITLLVFTMLSCSISVPAQSLPENVQLKPVSEKVLKENFIQEIELRLYPDQTFELNYVPDLKNLFKYLREVLGRRFEICGTGYSDYIRSKTNRVGTIEFQKDTMSLISMRNCKLLIRPEEGESEYMLSDYLHLDSLKLSSQEMIKIKIKKTDNFQLITNPKAVFAEKFGEEKEDSSLEIWTAESIYTLYHPIEIKGDSIFLQSGTPYYWDYMDMCFDDSSYKAHITKKKEKYYLEFDNEGFSVKIPIEWEPIRD